jgi:integrase
MTGSLQVKNDKFYIIVNLKEDGKRKQKWIATGLDVKGNKRKAEQLLREALVECEKKPRLPASDILFSDYIRAWLKVAERRVDSVTFQGYKLMANAQVIPYFDQNGLRLQEVTRADLQAFFDEKAARGRKDGKGGLSPSSLRQYKNIILQTLNEAVKNDLIRTNPCQFIELPKKQRYESSYYSAEQLKTLFEAIRDDPIYPLVKITALYGLRRSEVLGLKWDSMDFTAGRLIIKHTVSKVTSAVCKDKTKNSSSHRSFPLTPEAREIFLRAKREEEENRRLCGKSYQENDFIFKWPEGTPFSPDYVSSHFALLLKNNGLPHIRFHELRHSCASLLLNSGFTLKDVQEYMGHADIQMTANIYGHLDVRRKQLLTEKMAASIF